MTNIFTIGYAGKSAAEFFETLKRAGIRRVIDVRLFNTSQLAGYTKKGDLEYLVREIVGAQYVHMPMLAPTKAILNGYKKGAITWEQYETAFNKLIATRQIERLLTSEQAGEGCLLCSEASAKQCHRRLVAEYLARAWQDTDISHL